MPILLSEYFFENLRKQFVNIARETFMCNSKILQDRCKSLEAIAVSEFNPLNAKLREMMLVQIGELVSNKDSAGTSNDSISTFGISFTHKFDFATGKVIKNILVLGFSADLHFFRHTLSGYTQYRP
jgi:hypothetical protein